MNKPLTKNIDPKRGPLNLKDYEKAGGYQGMEKALKEMQPGDVTKVVKDSGLRGRGGAGFPTGVKWGFVPMGDNAPHPKYLICNADEMEPGTYKDRLLMEQDPHLLVESMIVSGYAMQADIGYIFLRAEYAEAEKALRKAIAEVYGKKYLGGNILGTNWSFELYIHTSAGRYICGEETALLNALEGKRAIPRAKPPFPPVVGLFGKPTIVNNVETLCSVPHIVNNGAIWYKDLSKTDDAGTKIYGVSGKVKKPGLWELPMGTTMREIIEEHAGGMQDDVKFRGVIPGGASTDFLVEEHYDLPMDYNEVQKAGSRLGTGTMIILDDQTCPVGMVHSLEKFFARESCGFCTPCRDGLPWVEKILRALEEGEGREDDIATLEMHGKFLGPGNTFCAFAPGAVEPLQSAIKYFRDDFQRHINQKRCPWR